MGQGPAPRHSVYPAHIHRTSVLPPSAPTFRRRRAIVAGLAVTAVGLAVLVPMTGLSSAATNLVKNPGIESGLKNWSKPDAGRSITAVKDAHSGSYAAQLTTRVTGAMSLRDTPNTVAETPANTSYQASAWVRTSTPGLAVSLRVREVKQSFIPGTNVRVLVRKQTADLTLRDTGWHKIAFDYTSQAGNQLDIGVFAWNAKPSQSLIVDDLSLVAQQGAAAAPTRATSTPTPSASTSEPSRPNVVPSTPTPPSPTPTPTAAPTTPQKPVSTGATLFGVTPWTNSGETNVQAMARVDATIGRSEIMRIFYPGLPVAWPGAAGNANRPVVVSFKAKPSDITAGTHDGTLLSWFNEAPRNRQIYWSFYHEPEDNIANGEFTAAQYRAAWTHLRALADAAGNPQLKSTLVLMDWSLRKASGRNWRDYYPGADVIDVLGWDAYNASTGAGVVPSRYDAPEDVYGTAVAISRAEGKPFGFAEWGTILVPGDDGTARAAWIRASTAYMDKAGALFSTYFDAPVKGEFRLLDAASQRALKDAITG